MIYVNSLLSELWASGARRNMRCNVTAAVNILIVHQTVSSEAIPSEIDKVAKSSLYCLVFVAMCLGFIHPVGSSTQSLF